MDGILEIVITVLIFLIQIIIAYFILYAFDKTDIWGKRGENRVDEIKIQVPKITKIESEIQNKAEKAIDSKNDTGKVYFGGVTDYIQFYVDYSIIPTVEYLFQLKKIQYWQKYDDISFMICRITHSMMLCVPLAFLAHKIDAVSTFIAKTIDKIFLLPDFLSKFIILLCLVLLLVVNMLVVNLIYKSKIFKRYRPSHLCSDSYQEHYDKLNNIGYNWFDSVEAQDCFISQHYSYLQNIEKNIHFRYRLRKFLYIIVFFEFLLFQLLSAIIL